MLRGETVVTENCQALALDLIKLLTEINAKQEVYDHNHV